MIDVENLTVADVNAIWGKHIDKTPYQAWVSYDCADLCDKAGEIEIGLYKEAEDDWESYYYADELPVELYSLEVIVRDGSAPINIVFKKDEQGKLCYAPEVSGDGVFEELWRKEIALLQEDPDIARAFREINENVQAHFGNKSKGEIEKDRY